MICNKCGNNVEPGHKFCDKCGSPIEQMAAQPNPMNGVQNQGPVVINQPIEQLEPITTQPTPMDSGMTVQNSNPGMQSNPFDTFQQTGNVNQMNSMQQTPVGQGTFFGGSAPMQQPVQPMSQPVQPLSQPMGQPVQPIQSFNTQQPVQPVYSAPQPTTGKNTVPPPNKPLLIMVGTVALIALVAIIAFALKPSGEVTLQQDEGTRTVMVYMIGSNLESEAGSATLDIEEMIASEFNEDNVNVLIYTGGAKKWYTPGIDDDENAIFEIKGGDLVKKKTFDKEIMTDPDTLTDFIDYVYENYDSDLYDLILWDHGGGPMGGYGHDENNIRNETMSLESLNEAISDSDLAKDTKFDFIGFDACLMGSIEVAYSLKNQANYLIASEELEPGYGWDYSFLGNIREDSTTEEVGTDIVDSYFEFYDRAGVKTNLTLSVIDLQEVEDLVTDVNTLFSKTDGDINVNTFSKYARKLTRKTVYGNTGRYNSTYDLVDLKDLSNSISDEYPEETAAVSSSLEKVIVYSKDNMTNTNGLSIYFPTNNKKNIESILAQYNDVKISKPYYDFLKTYSSYIKGNRMVDRSGYRGINPLYTAESVSVTLPQDLVDNYEKADYIIFRKVGDNNYIPVYKSSNVTLDGTTLSAVPTNQQLIVENPDGTEPGWTTMYEVYRGKDYTDYNVVAILEKYDETLEEPLQLRNVNLIYRVKDGEMQGEFIDAQLMSTSNAAEKTSVDLSKWQKIQFFSSSYKLFDENNNYLEEWESNKEYYINSFDIASGYNVKFVGLDYDLSSIEIMDFDGTVIPNTNYEYYYMFRVSDTQGEVHQMNLVKVN